MSKKVIGQKQLKNMMDNATKGPMFDALRHDWSLSLYDSIHKGERVVLIKGKK